jgi:uncharacterized protein YbbK (DUF523 family)
VHTPAHVTVIRVLTKGWVQKNNIVTLSPTVEHGIHVDHHRGKMRKGQKVKIADRNMSKKKEGKKDSKTSKKSLVRLPSLLIDSISQTEKSCGTDNSTKPRIKTSNTTARGIRERSYNLDNPSFEGTISHDGPRDKGESEAERKV